MSSGVPQGTVLGPVLFLLYINDLPKGISSEVRLFADDTVLFRQICCPDDHHRLQHDLHQLEQWAAKWQMRFAPTKCFVLSVTLRTNSSHFSYRLSDTGLEEVKYYKYLGVYITSSLSWSLQCEEVKRKANKILCVLQRNLSSCDRAIKSRAYASLVRPIAEYASVAWSPHTAKDVSAIESIQRRAARFVFNDYSRYSSVSAMLADLNWQSLEERRIINDLTMFYKINFNFVNISFPAEIKLGFQGTRRSHDYKFMPLSSSVNAYKYSFFPRTIPVWNGLPFSVIHASTVNHFKASIVLN